MSLKPLIPKFNNQWSKDGFVVTENGHWDTMYGWKAFDQNNSFNSVASLYHNCGNPGDWLKIKFPKRYKLKKIFIQSGSVTAEYAYRTIFNIMYSNNDNDYSLLKQVTYNNYKLDSRYGGTGYTSEFTYDIDVECQYIKIVSISSSNNCFGHIGQFQVYVPDIKFAIKSNDTYIGNSNFSNQNDCSSYGVDDIKSLNTKIININDEYSIIKIK